MLNYILINILQVQLMPVQFYVQMDNIIMVLNVLLAHHQYKLAQHQIKLYHALIIIT